MKRKHMLGVGIIAALTLTTQVNASANNSVAFRPSKSPLTSISLRGVNTYEDTKKTIAQDNINQTMSSSVIDSSSRIAPSSSATPTKVVTATSTIQKTTSIVTLPTLKAKTDSENTSSNTPIAKAAVTSSASPITVPKTAKMPPLSSQGLPKTVDTTTPSSTSTPVATSTPATTTSAAGIYDMKGPWATALSSSASSEMPYVNYIYPGQQVKYYVSSHDMKGRTLQYQSKNSNGTWTTLQQWTSTVSAYVGGWISVENTTQTKDVTYRLYVPAANGQSAIVSAENTLHYQNPNQLTGKAAEAYSYIKNYCPNVTISIYSSTQPSINGDAYGLSYQQQHHISLSSLLWLHPTTDVKATALHECGHLLQWDAYHNNGYSGLEYFNNAAFVFGKANKPLEASANCIAQYLGAFPNPASGFTYCNWPNAKAYTEAVAKGKAWLPPSGSTPAPAAGYAYNAYPATNPWQKK